MTAPIDVEYSADSPVLRARLQDLSEVGMFLDTRHPLGVGTRLDFRFVLPPHAGDGEGHEVSGTAKVVWSQPNMGVGAEFASIAADDREAIRLYVASVFFGG